MSSLEELFCHVDDCCKWFEPRWHQQLLTSGATSRLRARSLTLSEILTILIRFHQSHYRNFKHYYLNEVQEHLRSAFPKLVSYNRFVEWTPASLLPLCCYLKHCFGRCSGISFIDATSLKVCHNRRIYQHRVCRDTAARGKTSVGWFYGFKLHLVVSDCGELLGATLTPGNTDDRQPVVDLLSELHGKVFADKGYVSKDLAKQLREDFDIAFFAKPRRNMKNHLMSLNDKLLARQRSIVETIIDQLKNISQIEHSRHRSPVNCWVNILCGLIAYCHQPKKPSFEL
ncbi:Transposase, IS4 family protein [Synechococcus sp. PCC 7335]|uniref:IS982 family transposase n=1 Tax=Synechococcus sp. (strain ATCC 29403 / PCC 7335) TaxID=91464 RepID=UPI00017ED8CB|nr:IS982 family transposase [Synechococcus sp. PCC 7335]EDX83800.1 Transposase, IS4 family protein [Synechococcus sp. PCC 7335]EDX85816.1 Transposase, IS4 family protein [Synechococcus sp. PCC 7335]